MINYEFLISKDISESSTDDVFDSLENRPLRELFSLIKTWASHLMEILASQSLFETGASDSNILLPWGSC
jgi:hypothetical protein